MIIGFIFYDFFSRFNWLTPVLLFLMLFFTFCSIDLKTIKLRKEHLFLSLFQVGASISIYYLLRLYDETLAQGIMICVLAPTAVAAVVISSMLGANVASVISYSLLINFVISIVAPLYFSIMNVPEALPFWISVKTILLKIFPLLILPLIMAIITKKIFSRYNDKLKKLNQLSFYLWIVAAAIVMGNTMKFIKMQQSDNSLTIILLIVGALVKCISQFALGYFVGKKFKDERACSQYMGQKNTILAIWMAQTFLNPIASIAPAAYVLWQNLVNTYQLWRRK